jgi:hypothetical protein
MRVIQRAVRSRHVHHVFAARACGPSCRVLMPSSLMLRSIVPCARATCVVSSPLTCAHVCSRHVHHTLAAHAYACALSCGVLMPRFVPSPPRRVSQHAVCRAPMPRHSVIPNAHGCGAACRVLMPRASYPPRSCVWSNTAVCSCHVPHPFTAHVCGPTCRGLTPCASYPITHALHHAVGCSHMLPYSPRRSCE